MIESVGITRLDDGEPIQNSITATLMCYLWQCNWLCKRGKFDRLNSKKADDSLS